MDNLDFNDYTVGGDYDTWGNKYLADQAKVSSAFGDTYTSAATGGTVSLTQSQSNCAVHRFTGALTSNLIVEVLASIGREWTVVNVTSGAFTVTYRVVGGAGLSAAIRQGTGAKIRSDGTDCFIMDYTTIQVVNDNTLSSTGTRQVPTVQNVKDFVLNAALTAALPSQGGNAGKFITTNGTVASWAAVLFSSLYPASIQAASFNIAAFHLYYCTNSAAAIATLPASPAEGDECIIIRAASANTVTVARNGKQISDLNEDFIIDVAGSFFRFLFINGGWHIILASGIA